MALTERHERNSECLLQKDGKTDASMLDQEMEEDARQKGHVSHRSLFQWCD
jgi:hypothetical protein